MNYEPSENKKNIASTYQTVVLKKYLSKAEGIGTLFC